MASFLEDLYFGSIRPCDLELTEESGLGTEMQELTSLEERLLKILDAEEHQLFQAFCEKQARINTQTAFENFRCGFRMGARLLLEVLEKPDEKV